MYTHTYTHTIHIVYPVHWPNCRAFICQYIVHVYLYNIALDNVCHCSESIYVLYEMKGQLNFIQTSIQHTSKGQLHFINKYTATSKGQLHFIQTSTCIQHTSKGQLHIYSNKSTAHRHSSNYHVNHNHVSTLYIHVYVCVYQIT